MTISISFWELGIWSAASSVTILIASELLLPHYGKVNILVETKKLRVAAAALVVLFVIFSIVNISGLTKT